MSEEKEILHSFGDEDLSILLGKLLTVVDASFADPIQRKAVKDWVKDTLYDWWDLGI